MYRNKPISKLNMAFTVVLLLMVANCAVVEMAKSPLAAPKAHFVDAYSKLPLSFEANHGQTASQVKFLARGEGYSLFLTSTEAVLSLRGAQKTEASWHGLREEQLPRRPMMARHEDSKLRINPSRAGAEVVAGVRQEAPLAVLRMKLVGANRNPTVVAENKLPGKSNYFIGKDPRKWRTNVATYAKVRYEGIYPGVDLVYYGNQGRLEYDFIVTPQADPAAIRLAIHGEDKLELDSQGNLVLETRGGEIRLHKPVIYQQAGGRKQKIAGGYVLRADNEVGFEIAAYDARRPLIIDPTLSYATHVDGNLWDILGNNPIATDGSGNAYITGYTSSVTFPTTNAFDTTSGGLDAFVAKINTNASGSASLVYSTYLGGSDGDIGFGIAADSSGNVYVTGFTTSSDFPTTANAFDTTLNGLTDAFVTKINTNASGSASLTYSTYLGGAYADGARAIANDAFGNAYVTGFTESDDFPSTANAFDRTLNNVPGDNDAFVAKINTNASGSASLVYSTYLGGRFQDLFGDIGSGIAVDSSGNAYVTGVTESDDFPTTANAFDRTFGQRFLTDAFVAKINTNASGPASLVYSTYLGGFNGRDFGRGIATDGSGNAYVTGDTVADDFPTTTNAFHTTKNGISDAFVAKINTNASGPGSLVYSTYLGGANLEIGLGVALDSSGKVSITGLTNSSDFPTTADALDTTLNGSGDAFVAKINTNASGAGSLVYSTYLGGASADIGVGIAADSSGNVYIAGYTESSDFPTANAFDTTLNGSADIFVVKVSEGVKYGICILYDPGRAVRSGSPIPIKIQLCDANGNNASSPSIVVTAVQVVKISNNVTSDVEDTGHANPDNNFRYDPTLGGSGGYIFNLSTVGLTTGTYELQFKATGDPTTHAVTFQVK